MITLFNYVDRPSPIHRLTGATKLVCLVLYSVGAMITFDTRMIACLTVRQRHEWAPSRSVATSNIPTDYIITLLSECVHQKIPGRRPDESRGFPRVSVKKTSPRERQRAHGTIGFYRVQMPAVLMMNWVTPVRPSAMPE